MGKLKQLIEAERVSARVAEMGDEISAFYKDKPYTVVSLVNGALFFTVDLSRNLKGNFWVDTLAVSSYVGEHSTGQIRIRGELKLPVAGREILLTDGVFDTGLTLVTVRDWLLQQGAVGVRCAVLAAKDHPRHELAADFTPDWVGFQLPDLFLVGCGMDADERYRQLPFVAVVEPDEE